MVRGFAFGHRRPGPDGPGNSLMPLKLRVEYAVIPELPARRQTVDWSDLPRDGRFWERKLGSAKAYYL